MQVHLDHALAIAREAHHGQTRRHGAPYIEHPISVRTILEDLAPACGIEIDDAVRAAALLHDVVEDSEISVDELRARFGDDVARRVDLLTKRGKGHDASVAYYQRLGREADDQTRLLKICDRAHNFSEMHLAPDLAKLEKYVVETRDLIMPVAAGASTTQRAQSLRAILEDAMRAASAAQGRPVPHARVPTGIYAVIAARDDLVGHVKSLVEGGVVMIQLRAKDRTDRDVLAMLDAVLPICRAAAVPLIVNDRADLCVAARVDGVHVGQTDLSPVDVRRIVGGTSLTVDETAPLVGASSHNEAELNAICADESSDLVAVGPVFASPTKSGHAPVVGVEALAARVKIATLPVVAIGGVTSPERAAQCARAGTQLVAAVSALDGAGARVMCRRMSLSFAAARAAS